MRTEKLLIGESKYKGYIDPQTCCCELCVVSIRRDGGSDYSDLRGGELAHAAQHPLIIHLQRCVAVYQARLEKVYVKEKKNYSNNDNITFVPSRTVFNSQIKAIPVAHHYYAERGATDTTIVCSNHEIVS